MKKEQERDDMGLKVSIELADLNDRPEWTEQKVLSDIWDVLEKYGFKLERIEGPSGLHIAREEGEGDDFASASS